MTKPWWLRQAVERPPHFTTSAERSLWTLTKDGHTAEARARVIDGVGLELRFLWDGELRASDVKREPADVERVAAEKRAELEARGWK